MRHSVAPFRIRTTAGRGALIAIVAALAGCSTPLVKSALTSNVVQEDAHNAYLLLNIVRAQERMPMHFTQVNVVRAAPGGLGIGKPSVALALPFGGAATPAYTLSPSVEMASSVDTASLVSQEFMRGITTPVDSRLMVYFANQGWPQAMVLHLFIGSMEVIDGSGRVIYSVHNSPFSETFPIFKEVVEALATCRPTLQEESDYTFHTPVLSESAVRTGLEDVAALKSAGLVPVQVNQAGAALGAKEAKTGLIRYASVSRESALLFTGATPNLVGQELTAAPCDVGIDAEKWPVVQALMGAFRTQNTQRLEKSQGRPVKPAGPDKPEMQVRFVMRSTQSMLYFLGELSRDYAENQRLLTIPVRASPAATLFVAKCCEQAPDAAVSVAYRSKHYHIDPVRPADNAGSGEDRSLQTLALVSLVYGLQNHSGEAPGIRNVRVIP